MVKQFRADIDDLRAQNNGAAARLRRRQEARREALLRTLADNAARPDGEHSDSIEPSDATPGGAPDASRTEEPA